MRNKLSIILWIQLVCLFAVSCKTSDRIRMENRESLMRLSHGMTKQEALNVMGTKRQWTDRGDWINNPYRVEMYEVDDTALDILYYYTDMKSSDGAITDDELTPLVFRDRILVGFGWSYWEDQIEKFEIRIR